MAPLASCHRNITAGAYDNNIAPAASTTFYMIDYDLDTFVTVADRNVAGNSNTGGGQLKTIRPIVDEKGNPLNFAPTAGLDIYTSPAGANIGFAVTAQDLYCIDLGGVNANLPVGTQQKVAAQKLPDLSLQIAKLARGGLIDVALVPFLANAAPGQADVAVTASDAPDPVCLGTTLRYRVSS